jgi:hypothetical protein
MGPIDGLQKPYDFIVVGGKWLQKVRTRMQG